MRSRRSGTPGYLQCQSICHLYLHRISTLHYVLARVMHYGYAYAESPLDGVGHNTYQHHLISTGPEGGPPVPPNRLMGRDPREG